MSYLVGTVPCSGPQMRDVLVHLARHTLHGDTSATGQILAELLFSERGGGLGLDTRDFAATAPTAVSAAEQWRARGESHGLQSELIVCHDGGSLAPYFNGDYGDVRAYRRMDRALNKIGMYAPPCTTWYTAIYGIEPRQDVYESNR